MAQMEDLYQKVAKDSILQAKFNEIMEKAQEIGQTATSEKLIAFSKDAGYDINLGEMATFFKVLAEKTEGELSDAELDMVAGGKDIGTIPLDPTTITFTNDGTQCTLPSDIPPVISSDLWKR